MEPGRLPSGYDGAVRYRYGPRTQVTEVTPPACRLGHPWGPGLVTVGWDGECRVYGCNRCWDEGLPWEHRYIVRWGNRAQGE